MVWRSPTPRRALAIRPAAVAGAGRTSGGDGGGGRRSGRPLVYPRVSRQKAPEVVEALCHQLTHADAEGYAACCEALAAADLRGEVGQIPLPTLIIAGESDPVTTVGDAHFLQQQIPASEVVVLAASHLF